MGKKRKGSNNGNGSGKKQKQNKGTAAQTSLPKNELVSSIPLPGSASAVGQLNAVVKPNVSNGTPTMPNKQSPFSNSIGTHFPCKSKDLIIAVMPEGTSFHMFGVCTITCLGGSIYIDGLFVTGSVSGDRFLQVCAPFRMGRPALIVSAMRSETREPYRSSQMRYKLKELSPEAEKIMELVASMNSKPSILLINQRIPPLMRTIQGFTPKFFIPDEISLTQFHRCWILPQGNILPYDGNSIDTINRVIGNLRERRKEGAKTVVVITGSKGAGKSTLLRHLVNRSLDSELPPVHVLDGDIGQSEFTPPGCLSLWKVNNPLLDMPWCHQVSTFPESIYFGSIQADHDTDKYTEIFDLLINKFFTKSEPGALLYVNTMGWIEGTGKTILDHIVKASNPYLCLSMTKGHKVYSPPNPIKFVSLSRQDYLPLIDHLLPPGVRISRNVRNLTSSELRSLNIVAYFSSNLPRYSLCSMFENAPASVEFSKVTLAIPEDFSFLDQRYFLGTLNTQIVALCTVVQEQNKELKTRRMLDRDYLPNVAIMRNDFPLLKCLGYAIIRSVDMDRCRFIIMTPVSIDVLKKVTVFARSDNINIPISILSEQPGTNLPYLANANPAKRKKKYINDLYSSLKQNSSIFRGHYLATT